MTMLKVLALLKEQENQIIEYGQINCNTIMLMNIKKCIEELEDMQGRSCMNCINNSFCGVYSFLKSVKNESDEIDTFNCPQHTRWSKE